MTDKELRRMSRADLVEIIYEVRKNEAALQQEVEALKKQLEEKQKKISEAGTLAELSADMNGLFEAAQATADQYLQEISDMYEDVRRLQSETERRASAVARQAMKERKELLEKTEEECERMRESAGVSRIPRESSSYIKKESAPRKASAEAVSYRVAQEAGKDAMPPETIAEEQADGSVTRELPGRKKVQEGAPRKKTSPPRKSARPASMNDRRKMQ